jgi:hypothetical protein
VPVSTSGTVVGCESCGAWNGLCSAILEAEFGPSFGHSLDARFESSTESKCGPIARLGSDLGSGLGLENRSTRDVRVAEYAGYETCSHRSYRA